MGTNFKVITSVSDPKINFQRSLDPRDAISETNEKNTHMYELVNENKRLWMELKKKDELTIALRDEIYFKERQLEDTAGKGGHQDDGNVECFENNEQSIALIREIRKLRADLREKQILVNFLNETLDHLCDQVLQNEHIDSLEMEMETLEAENQLLHRENSEIKVKLKILEYDNEKIHARYNNVEAEYRKIKVKLEKMSKRLRQKEHSILGFKKFTELAHNLQSRILRTKSENNALKKVIDQMKQVASNYENLENENTNLKETIRELEERNTQLIDDVKELREMHLKITERVKLNPKIMEENALLRKELAELEDNFKFFGTENEKLKSNLKVYEKHLIENKIQIEKEANRAEVIDILTRENKQLKMNIDTLNDSMQQLLSDKYRIMQDNQRWQTENREYANKLSLVEKDKMNLMTHISKLNRNYEEAFHEKEDLKRQLDIYRNTAHNIEAALKIREEEMKDLQKENNELKLRVKQYESQIQMTGKVHKLVR